MKLQVLIWCVTDAIVIAIKATLVAAVCAFPLMLCWNYAVPHFASRVFGQVSYWDAACIILIAGLLMPSSSCRRCESEGE